MAYSAWVAWYNSKKPAIRRRVFLVSRYARMNPCFILKTEQIFNRNEYDWDQQRWREIHGFEVPNAQNV